MTLRGGTKLGPYEIVSPLGAGGMGEVYRARDTRLDRDVAIKVLPAAMSADPERVARFQREAKLSAALNHPNIAAVYGFEESEQTKFLVLEFVDGQTLAERLRLGPLPLEETLQVCKEIAGAVEAAHEGGVIHRDLKPGNVMVKPDGDVKVLDFGLARAVADDPPSTGALAANSPTITVRSPAITEHYTRPGVVLGTAAYMSPEQARGRPLDQRTDIWSLGVVLYECLSGSSPFAGETVNDSIGAVLHKNIDLDRLPASTPPSVRDLLRRCLQRDRHKRLQAAGDARVQLEEALEQIESGQFETSALPSSQKTRIWQALTLLLVIALGASLLWRSERDGGRANAQSDPELVVMELTQLTNHPGMETKPHISPDGRMLLFVARDGNDLDIFLQRVGGENAINLTAESPDDDYDPAFSPSGEQIAFRSQREGGGLFVMGATGESPRRVSNEGFDPAWSPDGTQLAFTTEDVQGPYIRATVAKLWIVDLKTREKRLLTDHDAVGPAYAPNGRFIAFWAAIAGVRDIFVIPAGGGTPQPVTHDTATDWNPVWSPDGRTLYFISDRGGSPNLWRVSIDPDTGKVMGGMRPVTAGVTGIDQATITSDGKTVTFMAPQLMSSIEQYPFDPQLEKIVREKETLYASTSVLYQFDVSPDGQRIAFRTGAPREDIVVMNLDGTGRRRLMDDAYRDRGPRWTPDGQWIVFYSNRGGLYDEWRIRPNGTDIHRLTATTGDDVTFLVPAPSGNLLAGNAARRAGPSLVLFEPDRPIGEIDTPLDVPDGTLLDFAPRRFSPDSRRLSGTSSNGIRVFDLESKSLIAVHAPDGGELDASQDSGPEWIDETRLLTWDEKRNKAFIFDVKTGSMKVLEGLEGPCDVRVVQDGRTIVANRLRAESDIWMLRLGSVDPD